MKRTSKKIIAVILALSLVLSMSSVIMAQAKESDVKITTVSDIPEASKTLMANGLAEDEVYPTIIIHGIGQADTYLLDDNGNRVVNDDGDEVTGWPISVEAMPLVKGLLAPLLLSLFTQHDIGLSKAAYNVAYDLLKDRAYDENAKPINNYEVEGYGNRSVAECTQEEKEQIYDNVPIQDYSKAVGEENLYYFAYNSFGDVYDIIDDLDVIIEKAKRETGKDKVNLVPISLGGAIAVAYVDKHQDGADVNKIVFIVPALDGSEIVGKVMLGQLDYSDEGIYRNMFTKLIGEDDYTSWLINIAIRLLPKQVFIDMFKAIAAGLTDSTLSKITTMWGLVPSSMYDELAEKYLVPGTEFADRVERFHNAQVNMNDRLKAYAAKGIGIYDVSAYGCELYSLIDSDSNSDKIIHSASTSMGATFSKIGETLPADYQQKQYTEYNFISPDRQVDASTCAFPFTTWYFGGQDHEDIGNNDVVVRLASVLLVGSKDIDVFSLKEYPQFNGHRMTGDLKDYLNYAKTLDMSAFDADSAARLQNAMDAAEANLAKTIIVEGETEAAEAELEAALVQVGARGEEDDRLDKALLFIFKGASEALYYFYGPRGFFE